MGLDIYLYSMEDEEADRLSYSIYDEDADGKTTASKMSTEEKKKWFEDHPGSPAKRGNLRNDDWYSVGPDLNVFGGGLKVIAAIPGVGTFKEPATHMLYHASDEAFNSYIQSAEITAEFCDEAIALIERDGSCKISWSG